MNAKPFLDANVIIYAFSSNDPRNAKAEALLKAGGVVNVQVLNEFANVSRRKQRRDWDEIQEALAVVQTLLGPAQPLTVDVHAAAIPIARDRGFSFYDSLIIAAALRAGCCILYSEDLQPGQTIERLEIRNPFIE
jgi:predicted nucleic acid-binding protein